MGDILWIAQGEYRPDTDSDRDRAFVLKSGVKMYGGFAGTESNLAQRDLEAHPTVLSGNIGNPSDSTDNSYTILYMEYPDTNTLIDGFVLQHGYAISDTNFSNLSPVLSGGAVYVLAKEGKGLPVFSHCIFRHNVAKSRGGAVFVHGQNSTGSTPVFRNCLFFNNSSGSGGAIFISGGNHLDRGIEFDHCHFELNRSGGFGGAIYIENAFGSETLDFLSCTVTECSSYNAGGFMYVRKSGVNAFKITIDSCEISKNESATTVSGLYAESVSGDGFPTIFKMRNSKIFENKKPTTLFPSFDGVFFIEAIPTSFPTHTDTFIVTGNRIWGNESITVTLSFGSLNAWAKVENNLLFNNVNVNTGGTTLLAVSGNCVEFSGNVCFSNICRPLYGHSISSPSSSLKIHDNLLYNNRSLGHASMYYSTAIIGAYVSPNSGHTDTAHVFNNVFYNNTTRVTENLSTLNTPLIRCTNNIFLENRDILTGNLTIPLALNADSIYFSENSMDIDCGQLFGRVTCGPNNLFNLDPLFRDTANGDYSLLPCSPLIDAGNSAAAAGILTDIAGNPRIQGAAVDIGAYEAAAFGFATLPDIKPACEGLSDGKITVQPDFGCEPYAYSWSLNASDGPELDGLPPGNYLLTVTDGRGRQILDTFTVAPAPQPALLLAATDVLCGQSSGGSLSASVSGGTPPFNYVWTPAAADTFFLSHLPAVAAGGQIPYALSVTDANGCADTASATIGLSGLLTLMMDGAPISCHGEADGWLSAIPLTGTAPFHWLWQGWPGSDSLAGPLGPGNYSVTVSDAYGCTASFAFQPMNEPDSLWATAGSSPQTDLSMPNGAAVVTTISGGTPSFGFEWDTGAMAQAIAGLTAGTYTVTVTDSRGCTATTEVEVKLMLSAAGSPSEGRWLLYPNPAADWVVLALPESARGDWRIELSDASGRSLRSLRLPVSTVNCRLDLHGLPSGTYTVTATEGGETRFIGRVTKR